MTTFVLPIVLLIILSGNLTLGWPFVQLGPGGIPINELVLLCCLAATNIGVALAEMRTVINLFPFLVWWAFCIGRAIFAVPEYGLWALRDASQALDSLFLIVGFTFARKSDNIERLFRWLPTLLVVSTIYILVGYSFKTQTMALSPLVTTANGESVALFGIFSTGGEMLLWAAMYLIITASERTAFLKVILAGALFCYTIMKFQARTTYLQLVAMLIVMAFFRRKAVGQVLSFIPLLIIAVVLVSTLGLKFTGRYGTETSFSFLADHIAAIFGISNGTDEAVEAAASGVDERLQWWTDLYQKLTADPMTLLTGLGFGFPLVPFHGITGIQVREPHNSLISVISRSGLIGLSAWVWMHGELFSCSAKCFNASRRLSTWREWQNCILVLLTFPVLVLVGAIGEDNMEKPYFAIPYYLFWGVLLGLSFWERSQAALPIATPVILTKGPPVLPASTGIIAYSPGSVIEGNNINYGLASTSTCNRSDEIVRNNSSDPSGSSPAASNTRGQ